MNNWRSILAWQVEQLATFDWPEQETSITAEYIKLYSPALARWIASMQLPFPYTIRNIKVQQEGDEHSRVITFDIRTRRFDYTIIADLSNWLGASVWTRRGTGRQGGNDLEDGSFNLSTWRKIVQDITEYETRTGRWEPNEA